MLQDLDRIGPELILMVTAGCVLLAGPAVPARQRARPPFGALAGLGASAIWAVVLVLRHRQAVVFSGAYSLDTFSFFFIFLFIGVAGLVIVASADFARK